MKKAICRRRVPERRDEAKILSSRPVLRLLGKNIITGPGTGVLWANKKGHRVSTVPLVAFIQPGLADQLPLLREWKEKEKFRWSAPQPAEVLARQLNSGGVVFLIRIEVN